MSQNRMGIESDIRRHYWVKWFVTVLLLIALFALSWFWPILNELFSLNGVVSSDGTTVAGVVPALPTQQPQAQQPAEPLDSTGAMASSFGMQFTAVPGTAIQFELDGQLLGEAEVGVDGVWTWTGSDGGFAASPGDRSAAPAPSTFNWENIENGKIAADAPLQLSGSSIPNGILVLMVEGETVTRLAIGDDGQWSYEGAMPALPLGNHIMVASVVDADGSIIQDSVHAISFELIAPENSGTTTDADEPAPATEAPDSNDDAMQPATEPTDETVVGEDEVEEVDSAESTEQPISEPVTEAEPEIGGGTLGGGTLGVLEVTAQMGGLEILGEAARITGFDTSLRDGGLYTIFAPTDEAFASLPQPLTSALLSNAGAITLLLQHHVVADELTAGNLTVDQRLATVGSTEINVMATNGIITIGGANLLSVDNMAENGVVHVIDKVLLPPSTIARPEIDSSGVAEFQGDFLTVVGSGEPESTLIVELNGEPFGQTFVGDDGRWLVAAPIEQGEYEIIAYSLTAALEIAVSDPVTLFVIE